MSAARIPLVIDVDTGTDDAVCVISAVSCPSEIDILGFTTVCGNVGVEKTSRNTLDLVEFLGHPAPVYVGAAAPLLRAPIHARSHGESGLGDVVLPAASGLFGKGDASDFIYRVASQQAGGIELLAVGPLTNLAVALARYPDLREKINHITLMGGGIRGGNMTIASEFNFYVDPEAAQAVFESGCKITMVGLDVTLLPRLPDWVFDAVSGGDRPVHRLTAQIMSYMRRRSIDGGGDEPNVHDMIALAARLQPHLFTF
jgi:inosine-uridine nucleoside N-ribohydrolase